MTKFRYGAFVILLIVALVATYFFFIKLDGEVLQQVPANAKTVTVVNTRSLLTKLFLEDLVKGKTKDSLELLIPNTLKGLDWTSTGVGIPDKVVLFTLEDTLRFSNKIFFITSLASSSRYNRFMDSLCFRLGTKAIEEQHFHYAFIDKWKVLLAWNNQFVTGVVSTDSAVNNLAILSSVLSSKKQQSVLTDTGFVAKLSRNFDVMFYIKSKPISSLKFAKGIVNEISAFVSYIHFNKGEIVIEAQASPKKESFLNELFSVPAKEIPAFVNETKSMASVSANINPHVIFKLLNQSSLFTMKRMPWMNSWDGRLNLTYFGNKFIETTYSTYEYDDNFNKVEVKKTSTESMMNLQALWGTTNSTIHPDSLVMHKNDTLLFAESNFVLKRFDDFFSTYNKNFEPSPYRLKKVQGGFSISIDNIRLKSLLKSIEQRFPVSISINKIRIKKTVFTISQGINASLKFYFTDKSRNALLSIVEAFSG